jgi:hypothetical protein
MVITDQQGQLAHSEMRFDGDDGYLIVGRGMGGFCGEPRSM